MDMNFPHEHQKRNAWDNSMAGGPNVPDHQGLLAQAIARQESSRSARIYVAASRHVAGDQTAVRRSFLEERMAFFAGKKQPETNGHGEFALFGTGRFHPDLTLAESNDMDG